MGSILGSWLSGVINVYLGWAYNFYINAAIALTFGVIWCICIFDRPEQNDRVTTEELIYICNNTAKNESKDGVKRFPPYMAIFKSKKVWTLVSYVNIYLFLLLEPEHKCSTDC